MAGATTPAARGADPEVPLNTAVAVLDVKYADRRLTPGAKRRAAPGHLPVENLGALAVGGLWVC